MVSRCEEDIRMLSDPRGGLMSQTWFQAWVLSEISVFLGDRAHDFSKVLNFSKCWWYFRYMEDGFMPQSWFQIVKVVQALSLVREICFSKIRLGILQVFLTSDGGSKVWEGFQRWFKVWDLSEGSKLLEIRSGFIQIFLTFLTSNGSFKVWGGFQKWFRVF